MEKRISVFFTGKVQGVGFRWTSCQLGVQHQLTGWVRNLSDGRVEALVEGKPDQLAAWLTELQHRFRIDHLQQQEKPYQGNFSSMEILR